MSPYPSLGSYEDSKKEVTIAPEKTQIMLISQSLPSRNLNTSIRLDDKLIHTQEKIEVLSIKINSDMTYTAHEVYRSRRDDQKDYYKFNVRRIGHPLLSRGPFCHRVLYPQE